MDKALSLDQRFDTFNPALERLELQFDAPLFGLKKGDLIDVLLGTIPKHNDLIFTKEEKVFRVEMIDGNISLFPGGDNIKFEESVLGVLTAIHRNLIESEREMQKFA